MPKVDVKDLARRMQAKFAEKPTPKRNPPPRVALVRAAAKAPALYPHKQGRIVANYKAHWRLLDGGLAYCEQTNNGARCGRPMGHDGYHRYDHAFVDKRIDSPTYPCADCVLNQQCTNHHTMTIAYLRTQMDKLTTEFAQIVIRRNDDMENVIEAEDECNNSLHFYEARPATLAIEVARPVTSAEGTSLETIIIPCCEDCYLYCMDNRDVLLKRGLPVVFR